MENPTTPFVAFPKIPRLSRDIVISEKIDGTNASIYIVPCREVAYYDSKQAVVVGDGAIEGAMTIFAGSRNRWIQPGNDNFGFAAWVQTNAQELLKLGPGRHFGEWFGSGIQRGYGLKEKRFALFNTKRWRSNKGLTTLGIGVSEADRPATEISGPSCCDVVPILYTGPFDTLAIRGVLAALEVDGSRIVPGFMKPEGIVIYHKASGCLFKKTLENDESGKSE